VRLAMEHRVTDRVPMALICAGINEPVRTATEAYLGRERGVSLEEYLRPLVDVKGVAPRYIGPPLAAGTDHWGVRRRLVSYGAGAYNEIEHYPLADVSDASELARYAWPDPDWFDYEGLPDEIAALGGEGEYALIVGNGNVFETSWYMRGFERMLLDFHERPEVARGILSRVAAFYVEYFGRVFEAARGGIDLAFTADDIGGQEGLLMSVGMWREFVEPHHARLNRTIHEFGAKVVYHTDGSVMEAVPGLIGMGIDALQALQFDARGMDPVVLKERYGERLCFVGGVSVQRTLPFGTVEQVVAEVRRLIGVLGKGGGYILGPSHAIQAGTPAENVVAMFDTAAGTRMT